MVDDFVSGPLFDSLLKMQQYKSTCDARKLDRNYTDSWTSSEKLLNKILVFSISWLFLFFSPSTSNICFNLRKKREGYFL